MQIFRPSRGGVRTATRNKKTATTRTWTAQFFCLADRKSTKPPKTTERVALQKAGLGLKKMQFKCTDDENGVHSTLVSDTGFPQLKDIGGFELLHCQSNCRDLQLITGRWSVEQLKQVIGVQAKIYIRPIQKNLSVKTINGEELNTSLKENCSTCGESFPLPELRHHVTLCSVITDDDVDDDNANELIEGAKPDSQTSVLNVVDTIQIPANVTTIVIHGSNVDETTQADAHMTTDDNTNSDINQNNTDDMMTTEDTDTTKDANAEPESISEIVESVSEYCLGNTILDPVDILRYYQSRILMGRKLDIEDVSELTEGDTNYIVVDRESVLENAITEISGLENLRMCLEVQFAGEVCFFLVR